jgi:histidinol-phosphate phosphatase family protein
MLLIVITNQSGIPRGLLSESTLLHIHSKLKREMEAAGARVAGIYYCPHLPDAGCDCRKPSPGLLHAAARDHGIDLRASYLVGDKPDDIGCGAAAGCKTVLVLTGQTPAYAPERFSVTPNRVCRDLEAGARWILADRARGSGAA